MSRKSNFAAVILAILGATRFAHAQAQNLDMGSDHVTFTLNGMSLSVQAVAPNIVHVQAAPDRAFFKRTSFAVLPQPPIDANAASSGMNAGGGQMNYSLTTKQFKTLIDSRTGRISFVDRAGISIVGEAGSPSLEPAEVQGEKTFHVRQQWTTTPDEALFGLGQHQYGLTNIKGYDIELWQHNTEVAVPLLVSSKGYGIFWNNDSFTKFGDPRDYSAIPPEKIAGNDDKAGGFTRTAFSDAAMTMQTGQRVDASITNGGGAGGGGGGRGRGGPQEAAVRWEGTITADIVGDYKFQLYANGGYKMWIDDKIVADHWRQNWLPWNDLSVAHFDAASKHKIKVEWVKDGGAYCSLMWKTPNPMDQFGVTLPGTSKQPITSLWSQVGEGIDYYFIYGGAENDKATGKTPIDNVIAGYRTLTGKAPMMPQWAFGLWQSRQRYETQQASLDVVKGFRDRKIPFDNIVQDWMYWRQNDWGSHNFDPQRFPNPDQWIKDIHAMNSHLMISVWGKFYPTTDNYKAMNDKGFMYPVYPVRDWVGGGFNFAFYDAFNPDARTMFWDQINDHLFSKGVDAWWMDATEPDVVQPSPPTLEKQQANMIKTAAGTGARVMNAYPLLNSEAVYEGQRKAAPDQRVFILTRSGYAGQQRTAAATWSGDISSTWTAMKKQIAAGLGYSISGLPYWTMDSGGFSVPAKYNNARNADGVDEWRELNTRWLQFAAFLPLMRSHGEAPLREMWQFGGETSDAYKAQMKIDRLHYQLFPYIYSLAGDVTQNDGIFLRSLVMDFPNDKTARDLNDQYMFGPTFMVSPVTTYKARTRQVYLPGVPGGWYDFWTGKPVAVSMDLNGGIMTINPLEAPAPYDEIPLHIRAGSIIPLGPDLQYIAEKKSDPLTLMVYTGADGKFSLYEDDGLTYQYEKGAFTRIPITWNNATKTLTITKRVGEFATMLKTRTINIVLVTPEKPIPYNVDAPAKPDKSITYAGDAVEVKF